MGGAGEQNARYSKQEPNVLDRVLIPAVFRPAPRETTKPQRGDRHARQHQTTL
jgi:hypothetical protein